MRPLNSTTPSSSTLGMYPVTFDSVTGKAPTDQIMSWAPAGLLEFHFQSGSIMIPMTYRLPNPDRDNLYAAQERFSKHLFEMAWQLTGGVCTQDEWNDYCTNSGFVTETTMFDGEELANAYAGFLALYELKPEGYIFAHPNRKNYLVGYSGGYSAQTDERSWGGQFFPNFSTYETEFVGLVPHTRSNGDEVQAAQLVRQFSKGPVTYILDAL